MIIPLPHLLFYSAALFTIGLASALTRRNLIGILISIELILNAVILNLVAFSRTTSLAPETGQVFAIFVIALAASAAVVGLAIVLALYRVKKSVFSDEMDLLKW